jgi:3D (Asp-Asp-Asp) domain-containing protein
MAGWKELMIDMLKLTDEVKRLNRSSERLQEHVVDVDKRVVRLETLVEISKYQRPIENDSEK